MSDAKEVKRLEKGLNLRIQEAKEGIASVINISQLPPGIWLMILGEFTDQIQKQNAMMIETERKAYEEGVKQDGQSI